LPYLLPIVVVGLVWNWIYHPLYGVLNSFLELMGLGSLTRGWLADGDTALYAVLGAAIWSAFDSSLSCCSPAFRVSTRMWSMLPRSTALTGCSEPVRGDPRNSARVDTGGLDHAHRRVHVIDFIIVMTNGGSGNRTSVLGFYAYNQAFQRNSVGYGTAVSILITVLSLIAAVAFIKLREGGCERG